MSQISLDFTVDGEAQLSRYFDLAENVLEDMSPIFDEWSEDFRHTMHNVFASEGAFEGRPKWKQLSPAYRLWKDINYPGRPILVRTGRMRGSLTDPWHPDHVHDIGPRAMSIGTKVPHSIFHQRGTVKMPQRKVIELTEPQKLRWVRAARRITWEALDGLAREQGLVHNVKRIMR